MLSNIFIKEYKAAVEKSIKPVDMSPKEVAGMYLYLYKGDPIGRLLIDMKNSEIPFTVGSTAKVLIESVQGVGGKRYVL